VDLHQSPYLDWLLAPHDTPVSSATPWSRAPDPPRWCICTTATARSR